MSFALKELKKILGESSAAHGTIVSCSNGIAKVATSGGVVNYATAINYNKGDRVVILDNILYKSATPTAVFFV